MNASITLERDGKRITIVAKLEARTGLTPFRYGHWVEVFSPQEGFRQIHGPTDLVTDEEIMQTYVKLWHELHPEKLIKTDGVATSRKWNE